MTREDINTQVHGLVQSLCQAGARGADVTDILLAYALAVGNDTHGPDEVGRHLFLLSLKYTADQVDRETGALLSPMFGGSKH